MLDHVFALTERGKQILQVMAIVLKSNKPGQVVCQDNMS